MKYPCSRVEPPKCVDWIAAAATPLIRMFREHPATGEPMATESHIEAVDRFVNTGEFDADSVPPVSARKAGKSYGCYILYSEGEEIGFIRTRPNTYVQGCASHLTLMKVTKALFDQWPREDGSRC